MKSKFSDIIDLLETDISNGVIWNFIFAQPEVQKYITGELSDLSSFEVFRLVVMRYVEDVYNIQLNDEEKGGLEKAIPDYMVSLGGYQIRSERDEFFAGLC